MFSAGEIREMIAERRSDAERGMRLATADMCRIAERIALAEAASWLEIAERTFAPGGPSQYMLNVLSVGLWRHGQEIDWALDRMDG